MAYGAGRSRLIAEMGKEQAFEERRYEKELTEAEKAAREESQGKTLWSTLGSIGGGIAGFFLGGPAGAMKGAAAGYTVGGEAGKWGYNWLGSDYDPEDYFLSPDMGRFNVTQDIDIKDVNERFLAAHESQWYKDLAGTGKAIGTLAYLGSDLGKLFQETGIGKLSDPLREPAETFHWS